MFTLLLRDHWIIYHLILEYYFMNVLNGVQYTSISWCHYYLCLVLLLIRLTHAQPCSLLLTSSIMPYVALLFIEYCDCMLHGQNGCCFCIIYLFCFPVPYVKHFCCAPCVQEKTFLPFGEIKVIW